VVPWTIAALALFFALLALASTRRLARRMDALNQAYWELRYDYTRLRAQVARLDPEQPEEAADAAQAPATPSVSFVPLSSIKKKPANAE
jgi:hypothetical protein